MDVAEMKMLRWMCDVAKMDRNRNEKFKGTVKATENLQENPGEKTVVVTY